MADIRDKIQVQPEEGATVSSDRIVKRNEAAKGFEVLARGWVVERTFAWLGRSRRLAKDWECMRRKALAFLYLDSIRMMIGKLCN
jgi:transposase